MLLPCKYAVKILLTPLCFFLWDLQATIFRTSYLIKKEKTSLLASQSASWWQGGEGRCPSDTSEEKFAFKKKNQMWGKNTKKGARNKGITTPLFFVFLCCEE
jgi:hypothetical protein